MPSPFGGINMMSYALRNFQSALETSGHNVANVNTPGYSRQRVDFAANDPHVFYSQGWKSLGQGVHISQIERIRDLYLDRSLTASNGQLGKFSAATSGLRSIEGVYGEPSDSGIVAAMGKFYDAWSGLGSNPTDPGAKFEVRNAGQVLADRVRGAWQNMDGQASQNKNQIDTLISQVNDLADQISKLNKSIVAASISGQSPNDLLDQRDQAIQQMGSLVNVHTETFQDGTVAVYA
ncbi:MAG: flagellar hook-associated protein FlgK, partial [Chthonomonadaceae bacterium]|nr:flagellar hook-associated protein FlgK [Chthonomonadaceae bacterium]